MYKRNYRGWIKHLDFILWDVVALQLAFAIACLTRLGALPYTSRMYATLAVMMSLIDVLVSVVFNTMHDVLKRNNFQEITQSLKQAILVLLFIVLYMFALQVGDTYSRLTVFLTALLHFVFGYLIRTVWKHVVPRIWKNSKKASMILVADEKQVPEILEGVNVADDVEYTGIVLSNRDGTGERIQDVPVVASLLTASDYICREWVDEVFIYPTRFSDIEAQQSESHGSGLEFDEDARDQLVEGSADTSPAVEAAGGEEVTVASLIEDCRQMAVTVHIRLPVTDTGRKSFVEEVGGFTVLTTAVNYASPLQLTLKRVLDILGGIVGSLIALIVIAVVGPKIKRESPGPILFKQTRIGLNGRRFQMLKIRSMYLDAEERKAELMKENRVSDGMMFKLDFDPRIIGNKIVDGKEVTGIGEKIRAGSWDEWPQFFNILMGQMSLVGTRPPTVDEWEKYKYHHRARLATKPGLTGMWQVSGRSNITDFEEVVKLDTEYINNWSIGLDIRILLKTVKTVFTKDGAM